MNICLIVPTKDRPRDLGNLFESLVTQLRKPDRVIIVDGSDNPVKNVVAAYEHILNVDYIPCRPPSLPKQRNLGIEQLDENAEWVGFLDDDLVLENDALETLEKLVETRGEDELMGIGMSILNQPESGYKNYDRFFLLDSKQPGRVTSAGFAGGIPTASRDFETDWLYGGATFWKKTVFSEFKYDEWFHGTGYMEDVDFSYRVSRKYKIMVSGESRCYHYDHPISSAKQVSIGEWQYTSWWYFFQKYKDFSYLSCFWAMYGLFMKNLIGAVLTFSGDRCLRAFGHSKGFLKILSGKALIMKGFSK